MLQKTKKSLNFPRNLQQDPLNGPLNQSIYIALAASNFCRGPLARSHSIFLMEISHPSLPVMNDEILSDITLQEPLSRDILSRFLDTFGNTMLFPQWYG